MNGTKWYNRALFATLDNETDRVDNRTLHCRGREGLEKHYLAKDQQTSDVVSLRMEKNTQ